MKQLFYNTLKLLRIIYFRVNDKSEKFRNQKMFHQKDYANRIILERLESSEPTMIARFGSTEIAALVNYYGVTNGKKGWLSYIRGNEPQWWWNANIVKQLETNAGFFPATIKNVEKFCELMIKDMQEVNILGTWLENENLFNKQLTSAKRVVLEDLEPFFSENPWTKALENKNVLVIHPFAETIENQYKNKEFIYENHLLPDFNLITLKAVQTIAGQKSNYNNWFEALDYMKKEMEKIDFDIAIIGCGAYGFPLAAHAKKLGKKGFHLGGVTQLLFGIKGRRWVDNPILYYPYSNLFNEHWIYPSKVEKPLNSAEVEDSCYW